MGLDACLSDCHLSHVPSPSWRGLQIHALKMLHRRHELGLLLATVASLLCSGISQYPAYCWGSNAHGQLGNGASSADVQSSEPLPVSGGLLFTQIAAGGEHTCGRQASGRVSCWGKPVWGEPVWGGRRRRNGGAQLGLPASSEEACLAGLPAVSS